MDRDARANGDLENLHATFVRNVEHELRTPLTIVQGYAELLQNGDLGQLAPEQQQAVFAIVNRANVMRTMIERIGVLLGAQGGGGAPALLDWRDLAESVAGKWREAACQAGLTLEARFEPDLPEVWGDAHQLRTALDCLLENAIKFTPRGGQVQVRAFAQAGWACWEVSDTGIGIAPDKLEHLFDGFYQADGSITRHYGGMGLGLTVARAVLEAHGGQLAAHSRQGVGSRFLVSLPGAAQSAQSPQASRPLQPTRRILVVDDEKNISSAWQAGLSRLPNCQVEQAASGEQALEMFEQQPFDLLITDYKLLGMDGLTLAAHVRRRWPDAAILMITAYSSDELRQQAQHISVRQVLSKPVRLAEIRSAAAQALEVDRAGQAGAETGEGQ